MHHAGGDSQGGADGREDADQGLDDEFCFVQVRAVSCMMMQVFAYMAENAYLCKVNKERKPYP